MRSYTVLLAVLFCFASNAAAGSDLQVEESVRRKASTVTSAPTSTPKPPPKKPKKPVTTASNPSSVSSGSESGSTEGSGATGKSSSTSSSGGTVESSGGSSGGLSASTSLAEVATTPAKRTGTLVFLGVAAVAGVAVAAATVPKRRVEAPAHPLKGALNRRINLFSHLANHANDHTARPPRRGEDGGYVNADDIIV